MPGEDRQLALEFPVPRAVELGPGTLDLDARVRAEVKRMIRDSGLLRDEIARRMSEASGRGIVKHHLDSWTAPSRPAWQFPFHLAPAFEAATGSRGLLELLAEVRGCRVLVGVESLNAEIGRLQREETELRRKRLALTKLLGGAA
jgi:hypothetical protein